MSVLKKNLQLINALALTVLCAFLFSFSTMPGGDVFEISVNDKTLIQQVVHMDKTVKSLDLSGYANETLNVYYSECGTNGTSRNISVRDGKKIIRSWNFDNVEKTLKRQAMTCRVKDILEIQKNNAGSKLTLVYSSTEHSNGHILANLGVGDVKAGLK